MRINFVFVVVKSLWVPPNNLSTSCKQSLYCKQMFYFWSIFNYNDDDNDDSDDTDYLVLLLLLK